MTDPNPSPEPKAPHGDPPDPTFRDGLLPCGRAWVHQPEALERGRMLAPGLQATDLASFFSAVAHAAPDVVFMPYLGVWDRHGRPVYAYDLLAYEDEVVFPEAEIVENPRVYGIARYDAAAGEARGADWFRRHHYDVEQVTEGTVVVDVPLHEQESIDVPERVERRTWPARFWDGIHEREGGRVAWDRVEVVGTLFENVDLLTAWGLDLPLPEVLRRLRLPEPDCWGALRVLAASSDAS